jgi:hypothetical protein
MSITPYVANKFEMSAPRCVVTSPKSVLRSPIMMGCRFGNRLSASVRSFKSTVGPGGRYVPMIRVRLVAETRMQLIVLAPCRFSDSMCQFVGGGSSLYASAMPPWFLTLVYVEKIRKPDEFLVWIGLESGILISVSIARSMSCFSRSKHACWRRVFRASLML